MDNGPSVRIHLAIYRRLEIAAVGAGVKMTDKKKRHE
jgi:hypothetical protein